MTEQWTVFFFFFKYTATTEIYTLSLHDALPISGVRANEKTASFIVLPFPAPRELDNYRRLSIYTKNRVRHR